MVSSPVYFFYDIENVKIYRLTLPTMGLLTQPQILGGAQCTPPISYACSTCAIVMKLSEIKQLDK